MLLLAAEGHVLLDAIVHGAHAENIARQCGPKHDVSSCKTQCLGAAALPHPNIPAGKAQFPRQQFCHSFCRSVPCVCKSSFEICPRQTGRIQTKYYAACKHNPCWLETWKIMSANLLQLTWSLLAVLVLPIWGVACRRGLKPGLSPGLCCCCCCTAS